MFGNFQLKGRESIMKNLRTQSNQNTGSFKVLFIGNSYSDDTIQWAWQIATSAGKNNVVIADVYHGGCTINQHIEFTKTTEPKYIFRVSDNGEVRSTSDGENYNRRAVDGILYDDWDWIVFQQGSCDSGIAEYYDNLSELIAYVRARATNPNVRFAFNMTWAYANGSTNPWFYRYNNSQEIMYNGILSAVQTKVLPNKSIEVLIPNGTAVQNARTSFVGDNLTRDGADHMTWDFGRYIAGLTFVSALTGVSVDDIAWAPNTLSRVQVALAKESVKNALANPFEITQSKYI